jgi:hypothetical protein
VKRPLAFLGGLAASAGLLPGTLAIQTMAGATTPFTPDFINKAPNNVLGDGVNAPAQAFNGTFPYLSQPYSGISRSGGTAASATGH